MVGALGYWASEPTSVESDQRFESHEFAVFRSDFETLRNQKVAKRAEHFQTLIDVTHSVKLAPGMAQALGEFCHQVAASESEAPEVKAAAERALQGLQSRPDASRTIAGDGTAPAPSGLIKSKP